MRTTLGKKATFAHPKNRFNSHGFSIFRMSFFRIDNSAQRIFGLDLLRFFAIMFVVLGHSKILLPAEYKYYIDVILLDGVSIFFVLSGFLIGGILIKQLEKEKPTFKGLLNFWSRRWLRTLPMYVIVLTFLVIYTFVLKPERLPADWFRYYFFIQNFETPQPPFFSEAWSLSIEEWFYLLTPVVLFGGLRLFRIKVRTMLLITAIAGVCAVVLYRFYLYHTFHYVTAKEVDLNVMRQVLTRLDAIMFGVIGAVISYYFPQIWRKGNILLVVLGFYLLYYFKFHTYSKTSLNYIVWMPALKSLCVLIMLPYLSRLQRGLGKLTSWITTISLISYSMYLINRTVVIDFCIKYMLHGNLRDKHKIDPDFWVWEYVLFWVLSIAMSFVLYKTIEIPFMRLRDWRKKLRKNP